MVDEVGVVKGLRGYGIKEEFAHAKSATAAMGAENVSTLAPLDLPPPKQGCCSAGGGLVAYAKALCQMSKCVSWKKKWIRMKAWCLELDGRQDKDECAKPTIGRARNLSNGNVAVFSLVRFQEKEMRKALQVKRPLCMWCEVAGFAVQQAIAYKPEPPSKDGGQFIPAPQSRLRN